MPASAARGHAGPALERAAEFARVAEADFQADLGHAQGAAVQQFQRAFGADAVVDVAKDAPALGQPSAQRALAHVEHARHVGQARLLAQRVNATTALLTRDKSEEPSLVLPQNFMSSWGDPTV